MGLYYAQAGLDQSLRLGVNVAKRVGLLSERNSDGRTGKDNGSAVRSVDRLERIPGRTVAT
jgi:hypothetical protein